MDEKTVNDRTKSARQVRMLSKFSVKKPFTVVVAIVIVLILGVVSYLNIGVDMLPGMNLPYIAVVTVYPGATPETVESSLTDPIEAAMSEVGDVKQITSVSAEHYSLVLLEFNSDADVDRAYSDVNAKLRSVDFPDDDFVQDPVVMKINPSMLPVMTLSVGVDGKSIKESSDTLQKAVDKIKGVDGVSTVDTSGLISDLIYVNIKTDRLIEYVVGYVYESFGLDLKLPDGLKEQVYLAFSSADLSEMTPGDAIDLLIDVIDSVGGNLSTDLLTDYLRLQKRLQAGTVYSLFEQLLTNKFVFREDADPALFGAFLDEVALQSVTAALRDRVGGVFDKLNADVIKQLIFAQDFRMPAGSVTEDEIKTLVKVGSKITTREEFSSMPIVSFDLVGAYSNYYDALSSALHFAESRTEDGTVRFSSAQLTDALSALRATIPQDSPLTDLFREESDEEIADRILSLLPYLKSIAPDAIDVPDESDGEYVVRVDALTDALTTVRDRLVVPLTLGAVADVTFFDNSTESLTFMLTRAKAGEDLTPSGGVIVSINKEPDKSTVEVTDGVVAVLSGLGKESEFEGFRYTVLSNDGEMIGFMLRTVLENLLFGALLAIAVLLLFLRSIKPTFVVGASIVISVVATFVMMYFAGISLNIVSMGGLALGVGMLVDNSIVVIENIYRVKAQGKDVYTAAVQGAKQVGGAIFASTLTTIVVFLPIAFISGLTKEIFTDMALTICFSLLASLLVALTLVPMAASTFMKKPARKETKVFRSIKRGYARALKFFLRFKFIPLVLVTVLFGLAIFAVFKMDITLFPQTDASTLTVSVEIDREGLVRYNEKNKKKGFLTYDDAVDVVMETLTEVINGTVPVYDYDEEEDDYVLVPYKEAFDASWTKAISSAGLYVAKGMSVGSYSIGGGKIQLSVLLTDEKNRSVGSTYIGSIIEEILSYEEVNKGFMDVEVTGGGLMNVLGTGTDAFTVRFYGEDVDTLRTEATRFADEFRTLDEHGDPAYTVSGLKKIETGLEEGDKEYRVVVDRTKAGAYGLTVAQVYQQVSAALAAVSASETVNLYTDDIRSENQIYVYDARYTTDAWYECVDGSGNPVKVYLKNNAADNKTQYTVDNTFGNSVYYRKGEGYGYAPDGERITVSVTSEGFSYTYLVEEDGEIKAKTVDLTKTGPEIFYSASRVEAFDLMTMGIVSADPLQTGAESVTVPLYKLVSDECLLRGPDGKILYREDNGLGERVPLAFEKYESYRLINHRDKKKTVAVTFTCDGTRSSREIETELRSKLNQETFEEGVTTEFSSGNPYVNDVFRTL
ncbi:MAG: efflux RND transporter permease subunit, partial [Clostridia bacterium]|nr:efflux RND transporter permease subunit [Clostridia bacterium]